MKNKQYWKFVILIIIFVGGIGMFSLNGKISEKKQKKELETSIAQMLVNDYEGVEKIEFQGWGYSKETGMWGTTVIVNDTEEIGLSFSNLSSLKEINAVVVDEDIQLTESENIITHPRIMDRLEKIKQTSLEGITIRYSEDSKED